LQLGQDGSQKTSKFSVIFHGIAMNREGSKQFGSLQILELLEAADKVDVEIEILELGQSLEFL
jgi:hypothetical protein